MSVKIAPDQDLDERTETTAPVQDLVVRTETTKFKIIDGGLGKSHKDDIGREPPKNYYGSYRPVVDIQVPPIDKCLGIEEYQEKSFDYQHDKMGLSDNLGLVKHADGSYSTHLKYI